MDHWRDGGSSSAVMTQVSADAFMGTRPKTLRPMCILGKSLDFLLQAIHSHWGMGSDNDRIQAMFQKDHPGAGEMGWHCSNG